VYSISASMIIKITSAMFHLTFIDCIFQDIHSVIIQLP
jgi:hypothetical protein